jgi:hypothetical protein
MREDWRREDHRRGMKGGRSSHVRLMAATDGAPWE